MDNTNRRAAFWIEQDHEALMRLYSASEVLRKDADQLRAKYGVRTHRTRHDTEEPAIGEWNNRTEQLPGFTTRECNHRLPHDRNAHLVGEPFGYFFAIYESHRQIPCCWLLL
jgi:hypothetical protein